MELLIVLTIAGMLVGLSGPLYSSVVPGARAKADARELIVTLRHAANAAVSSGQPTHIRFVPAAARYTAGNSGAVELSEGTELAVTAAFEPTRRPGDDGADGGVTMTFFPDGSSTGGTIRLGSADRDYLIGVDWLTGRVEILEQVADAR